MYTYMNIKMRGLKIDKTAPRPQVSITPIKNRTQKYIKKKKKKPEHWCLS